MISTPKLEARAAQPYVALLRRQVPIHELGRVLPPLHDEILHWLQTKSMAPAGAPFFRYLVVEMEAGLFDVEVGWPVATPLQSDGEIIAGQLPAGRYGVIINTGPFDDLTGAHQALMRWGEAQGLTWKTSDHGWYWDANLEFYLTDPAEEPNPQKWETEIAYLTA